MERVKFWVVSRNPAASEGAAGSLTPAMYKELIEACKQDDRRAQKQLYEHFYARMMGVCLRYASHREEAREILNTGFFKVFKKLKDYDVGKGNFEAWVYRIIVNTAIDHYRVEARHRTSDIDEVFEPADESDILSELSAEEILAMVQQLTPAYRTVFNMYVMEGFTHKEIGEKLGINEGTSKSNLAKARRKLQDMITDSRVIKIKRHAG